MTDRWLTPQELATRLRRPLGTVYQWNSRGGGPPFYRIRGRVLYKEADVEKWLEDMLVLDASDLLNCGRQ